jgi:hypothetical protein
VTLDILILCDFFLSSTHIGLHALILLPKHHTIRIWVSYLVSYAWPCSHESRTSISIHCDVEFGLCLCESVVVSHLSRCELTV